MRFTSRADLWAWIEARTRPKVRTYVFAHNWAFDGPVLDLFRELPARGWRLVKAVVECPPVILVWRKGDRTLHFLDTLNLFRVPLRALGESIGLPKLDMPKDDDPVAAWDAYGRRDVEVIRLACLKWWAFLLRYDLGGFAPTLAGQALRAFRHRFMDQEILLDDHEQALQIARASLFGGRVEAFRLGRVEGPIRHYDVNSMYPHVMRDGLFPAVLRLKARDPSLDELRRWTTDHAVCAEVLLDTDEPRYPKRVQDRLCFPVGRFVTALTTPELRYALLHGHVVRGIRCAVYTHGPLFSRFISEVYRLRLEARSLGNDVDTYLLKILMNSLYGKFAQHGGVWETVGDSDPSEIRAWREYDAETREVWSMRAFGGILQQKAKTPESTSSHPAIAAHVTAYARSWLWDLMAVAGRENVVYVDTDSLMVTEAAAGALAGFVSRDRLGALKDEGTYPWLTVHGAKDYQTPEKRVLKGVTPKAQWLSEHEVLQEEWSKLAGLIRTGSLDAPTTVPRHKLLSRLYSKGRPQADGSVLPLQLREA